MEAAKRRTQMRNAFDAIGGDARTAEAVALSRRLLARGKCGCCRIEPDLGSQRKSLIDEGPANRVSITFGDTAGTNGFVPGGGNLIRHIADDCGIFFVRS